MIYKPRMLLMDEPFAALDAQLRQSMHRQLLESVRLEGQTVMFVTHDINEALVVADRVVMLGGSPARTTREFTVPFGRDRDTDTVRFEPQFRDLEAEVNEALNAARTRTEPVGVGER
jgi:NitT/TauT family transport system ATP-binding protein